MILTDGFTPFIYNDGIMNDDQLILEKSTKTSAGGTRKTQVSGKRYQDTLQLRLNETQYGALMALLDQPVATYDFTPSFVPSYASMLFPMEVTVEAPVKKQVVGGGVRKFYVELQLESVGYV